MCFCSKGRFFNQLPPKKRIAKKDISIIKYLWEDPFGSLYTPFIHKFACNKNI